MCRRRGRAATYGPAAFPVETWNQHAAGSDGIVHSTSSVKGGTTDCSHCSSVTTQPRGLHEWDSAGHPAPEITISAGHDWSKSLVCKKVFALSDRVARAVATYGRAEVLVYLRSIVARIDMCYCNSKYSDLYEHYVNSVKLVANNKVSLTVNMFIVFVVCVLVII